jgi:hypothetical protein
MNSNYAHSLYKGAWINGILNAIINGLINWFSINKNQPAFLTQDSISSLQHTVFSGAVVLSVSLAFILTSIAYFTTKIPGKPPYFPKVFVQALKHSIYAFGLVAITGLLIQRYAGSIEVSHLSSAVISGVIAGIVAGIVDYETKKALQAAKP